ncbi:MAG TPA: hypothetical protein VFQ91_19700 [Bryobacteraceae bacterium]|nr:hypothetical protein [Bryobacteraceae bacterium]
MSFADEERIRTALAAAAVTESAETPARVEAALLAGLRRRNRQGMAWRAAAAGAIAATVWIGLLTLRPGTPEVEPALAQQPKSTEPAAENLETVVAVELPAAARQRPAARPARRPAAPGAAKPTAERVIYIPVGTWQAYEPIERGSIVRVRLPKSSLPNYGIPVSPDRWNESIPAEVVLGEDGSMRAIRFVSPVQ